MDRSITPAMQRSSSQETMLQRKKMFFFSMENRFGYSRRVLPTAVAGHKSCQYIGDFAICSAAAAAAAFAIFAFQQKVFSMPDLYDAHIDATMGLQSFLFTFTSANDQHVVIPVTDCVCGDTKWAHDFGLLVQKFE